MYIMLLETSKGSDDVGEHFRRLMDSFARLKNNILINHTTVMQISYHFVNGGFACIMQYGNTRRGKVALQKGGGVTFFFTNKIFW